MKYVGAATVEKMRKTRLHMFARALADVLYSANVYAIERDGGGYWKTVKPTPETKDSERKFASPLHVFVGPRVPDGESFLVGNQNNYVDVRKLLFELMHELERLALKEVT